MIVLTYTDIETINSRLDVYSKAIHGRFARKVRPLKDVDRYKATELRQLLLYSGLIIFKGILYHKYYEHFLCLKTALTILCSINLTTQPSMLKFSSQLLDYFVKRGIELFGERFAIYNVHSLLHFVDDVKLHGPLDMNSSFKYENYMPYIKFMIRNGKN